MATVGLQSLLFSGFFPVEGSKSDPHAALGSRLLGGEQLLPPAADFASLIRSAILNRETSPPFIAVEGLAEMGTAWGDLAEWVSDLLGRPVRLEPTGSVESFQILQIFPETEPTNGATPSDTDRPTESDPSSSGWTGVLLVGNAKPFEEVTPEAEADRGDSPRPTIVLMAPRNVDMEKPFQKSEAPILGEPIPIPLPEEEGTWKETFATSFEILLITTAPATPAASLVASEKTPSQGEVAPSVDKPIAGDPAMKSIEPTPLLATLPGGQSEKLILHPQFVGAVREAIAQWTSGFEASKSTPPEGQSLQPEASPPAMGPKTAENEGVPLLAKSEPAEGMPVLQVSKPKSVELPVKPQMEGMWPKPVIHIAAGVEAAAAAPLAAPKIPAQPKQTAPASPDAPPPAPSSDPIKIPFRAQENVRPVDPPVPHASLKTPEPAHYPAATESLPKTPETRMVPVRVQVVMGDIAQRLESLAGRILETRSDRSQGAVPPVAGPIIQGAGWSPPLRPRPVNPTVSAPPSAPVMTSGDVEVEPQPVKTSSDGPTVQPAAAVTRQTQSEVQVPSETAKGFPLPKPEGTVREAAPLRAVEEPETPVRSNASKELESDSRLPRRIEPTQAGDLIVPKAAERTIQTLPLEASAGVSIDRSPLSAVSVISTPTVSRSEVLSSGVAPTLSTEAENAAVEQIARNLRGQTLAHGGEIKIRLAPESLGEIHLKITVRAGQLIAEIRANSEGTREILARNTTQLQGLLAEAGSGVEKVVIRTGGFGGDLVNPSAAARDAGAGGDSAEDRERTPKDRQENQSQQREQSKGNKRRFLWERFV